VYFSVDISFFYLSKKCIDGLIEMSLSYAREVPVIKLQLPFPPSELSPNKRLHWGSIAKAKANFRAKCNLLTRDQHPEKAKYGQDFDLTMVFVPPDRRHYDRDNLIARMKSGLDGMCDALGIDDIQFMSVTASLSRDSLGGFVQVSIHPNLGENYDDEDL
jgi:crossover junction endodeoxyribonuclease RusA